MWIVKLKSGTSYYYAVPKYPVDSEFMAALLREDHCKEFIEYIFDPKKGIKPKFLPSIKTVMDEITIQLTSDLAETRKELDAVAEARKHSDAQLKQTVEKLKVKEKTFAEEKEKLKQQISEIKEQVNIEGAKEDKRQIDALRQENLQLKKDNAALSTKLDEAEGTNRSLKMSYEESLKKAEEDVKTANDQKDAVAKAKKAAVDEYEAKIKQMSEEIEGQKLNKVNSEQIANLNEFIDQLQAKLSNSEAECSQLLTDFTKAEAHSKELEQKLKQMEGSKADEETLAAMQEDRKALKKQLKESNERAALLESANDKLREEIDALTKRLETAGTPVDFTNDDPTSKVWTKLPFRVKRVGPLQIESDWFTENRYSVSTTVGGNKLIITPSEERGMVACKDYVLEIYNLDAMVPYTKNKPLDVVYNQENNEIMVTL